MAEFPDHVGEAMHSVAQLHSEHRSRATTPQRWVNWIAALLARPGSIALVGFVVTVWISANLVASRFGLQAIDSPAFP